MKVQRFVLHNRSKTKHLSDAFFVVLKTLKSPVNAGLMIEFRNGKAIS